MLKNEWDEGVLPLTPVLRGRSRDRSGVDLESTNRVTRYYCCVQYSVDFDLASATLLFVHRDLEIRVIFGEIRDILEYLRSLHARTEMSAKCQQNIKCNFTGMSNGMSY